MSYPEISREQWEQEKENEAHKFWTSVNQEAAALLETANTGKIDLIKLPEIEILKRIGEITGERPEMMDGVNSGLESLIYKNTIFFYSHRNNK